MTIFIILSALGLLINILIFLVFRNGMENFKYLRNQPDTTDQELPTLSVIVPALDEESTIANAMQSLLENDYPKLQIIAVNDRSTDRTGIILDEFARRDSRLKVIHIQTLPPNWLGKNHAMHQASKQATGEYVLYTDADVVFAPGSLRKAVNFMHREQLDHISVLPDYIASNALIKIIVVFLKMFLMMNMPWATRRRKQNFLGIGQFNLVRRAFFERIGGFTNFPLAIVEDMVLAWTIKQYQGQADFLLGNNCLFFEWYPSIQAFIKGLSRNAFCSLDYQFRKIFLVTASMLLSGVWIYIGLIIGLSTGQWHLIVLNLAAIIFHYSYIRDIIRITTSWSTTILPYTLPGLFITLYSFWNSTYVTLKNQAIEWRGTRYPLSLLKKHHIKMWW